MLFVMWLMTATMYQLTIAIRVVFQEIGKARAETRKNVFFIYSVIMATLQIVLLCLIPAAVREENLRSRVVSYVYAFSYLVATTTYSIIIY